MLEVNKGNTNMSEVISYLQEALDYDKRNKAEKQQYKLQIKTQKQQAMLDRLEMIVKRGV